MYVVIAAQPYKGEIVEHIKDDKKIEKAKYTAGIHFGEYSKIPVKVTGMGDDNKTYELDPKDYRIETFEDMNLHPRIMQNIREYGYVNPTPVQKR